MGKAADVKVGAKITDVAKAMEEAGYSTSGMELFLKDPDDRLDFWSVDDGTLLVGHSAKTGKVTDISYHFCDERAKSVRKEFTLNVDHFDTKSGAMLVRMKKQKVIRQGAGESQAKQSLTPKFTKNFGDVFDATIEFVEKPNTYYAQNLIKMECYAKVVAVDGKALAEPVLIEYRCIDGDFELGQTLTLRAYEDLQSSGINREWDGEVRQFNYGIAHFLGVKQVRKPK